MDKRKLYLSTIDPEAASIAQEYGIGLEIAEYCTAWNMDDEFDAVHPAVTKKLTQLYNVGVRKFDILNDDFGSGSHQTK